MDRPEERGSLKVDSISERATGALEAVGEGTALVAVGGTGVGSVLQASDAKSASPTVPVNMKCVIFKSHLSCCMVVEGGVGLLYITIGFGVVLLAFTNEQCKN